MNAVHLTIHEVMNVDTPVSSRPMTVFHADTTVMYQGEFYLRREFTEPGFPVKWWIVDGHSHRILVIGSERERLEKAYREATP